MKEPRSTSETGSLAGSTTPELPAVFVCEDLDDVSFLLHMARVPTDVWSVDVDGIWLENGPSGWQVITDPVAPERLSLIVSDIPVGGSPLDQPAKAGERPADRPSSKRPAERNGQPRRRISRV
jgi:hypothetical protein